MIASLVRKPSESLKAILTYMAQRCGDESKKFDVFDAALRAFNLTSM
jgi:hypothetical protein